jgi:nickel-dependent lactate racemase
LEVAADAVITSAAGYPLDLTFYQTVKGITAAQHIVKPGGRILVIAQCAEGVGSREFARRLAGLRDFASFLEEIRESAVEVDQWQLEKLALVGEKSDLFFFTPGVTRSQLGFLGSWAFSTLEEAVASVLDGLPAGARVALVPEGPYTFARAEQPVAAG